jgi:hypothetical protein
MNKQRNAQLSAVGFTALVVGLCAFAALLAVAVTLLGGWPM